MDEPFEISQPDDVRGSGIRLSLVQVTSKNAPAITDIAVLILSSMIYANFVSSLIRGGHTFSIIRASRRKIGAHRNAIDFLLALNQDTISLHKDKVKSNTVIIYDSDSIKSEGIGVPLTKIIKEENAPEIMRNTCIIGSLCKIMGLSWDIVANVFQIKLLKRG